MQWITDNWLILLFGGGMIAMHLFGHGGHGKHKTKQPQKPDDVAESPSDEER